MNKHGAKKSFQAGHHFEKGTYRVAQTQIEINPFHTRDHNLVTFVVRSKDTLEAFDVRLLLGRDSCGVDPMKSAIQILLV